MLNSKLNRESNELSIGNKAISALGMGLALMTSACGSGTSSPVSQIVTNVTVKTSIVGTDEWVQATATLNTGGFQVAGINLPVTNPNTHQEYGQVNLVPALCSQGCTGYSADLTIALNITQISQQPGANALLPNGTMLPVGGLQNATTIAVPIANTGALLYFAFGKGVAMLGTAIPFSALDPAGQYVPGIDIFQPIPAGPVEIIAGIFAGAAPKTTGIGLFIDLSGVLNTSAPTPAVALNDLHGLMANHGSAIQSVLTMQPVQPSARKVNKLYRMIYDLSQQGLTLDMNN